ncbi:MAG: DUF5074 domain-containing protein [Bacteroidota bacterium]
MTPMNKGFVWMAGWLLLMSCTPESPEIIDPPAPESGHVFVLNEGNFQWGNASLDKYDPETKMLQSGLFQAINQFPLGDVLQSMTVFDGKMYLVVNNSGKIELLDPESLESIGTIDGLSSPRYFLGISSTKAYVSDLYANAVSVLDLATQSVSGKIPIEGWTEQMVLVNEQVFVTNVQRPYLFVLDPQSDQLIDSIRVRIGGNGIVRDKQGMLWLACGEILQPDVEGALYKIDPETRTVIDSFLFPIAQKPSELQMNAQGDALYFLTTAVVRMSIEATDLPADPLIPEEGGLWYGLGIDPATEEIYLADAIDYVQKGVILRYTSGGELIDEFRAGIIPGGFYFQEK